MVYRKFLLFTIGLFFAGNNIVQAQTEIPANSETEVPEEDEFVIKDEKGNDEII